MLEVLLGCSHVLWYLLDLDSMPVWLSVLLNGFISCIWCMGFDLSGFFIFFGAVLFVFWSLFVVGF